MGKQAQGNHRLKYSRSILWGTSLLVLIDFPALETCLIVRARDTGDSACKPHVTIPFFLTCVIADDRVQFLRTQVVDIWLFQMLYICLNGLGVGLHCPETMLVTGKPH